MNVLFVQHSCFLVETDSCYLLFDYYTGELPAFSSEKPLYIFASHQHPDHFSPEIFDVARSVDHAQIILAFDIKENRIPDDCLALTVRMAPHETIALPQLTAETLFSTDKGVAYLVTVSGKCLYHAGDLNCWQWAENSPRNNEIMETLYLREISRLKNCDIFAAFLPLDPRQKSYYDVGMRLFLEQIGADHIFPMHMWGQFDAIDHFCNTYPGYAKAVEIVSRNGQSFSID